MSDTLMNTYSRLPVTFTRGEGAWLWDTEDNRYLDAISGIAVCNLGHSHAAVADALCQQGKTLVHTSNLYGIGNQQALADKLTALCGMEKVFFGNSGAEANEAAIKLARLYGHQKDIKQPAIIVMDNSFHGRTLATLTATGNRKVQAGFEPLLPGFVRVPYNDLDAVRAIANKKNSVAAVLVEPVQGEGGVNVPDADYLNGLRDICDEQDWLLMLDEIQTGMGRTGEWFAFQHNGIKPDVMTLAKALGNGVPIGACLAQGKAAGVLKPGSHGSTYGGNPLVCAAALAVVDTMQQNNLPARAKQLGETLLTGFKQQLADNDHVVDIRSKGLMLGIELDVPCGELVKQALQQQILINVTAEKTIRLLPPLIMSDEQAQMLIDAVVSLVNNFTGGNA